MAEELSLRLGLRGRTSPDLSVPGGGKHVHVVAAGGAAMNAICRIMKALGWTVTGSDLAPSDAVERLRADGIAVTVGHDSAHIVGCDLVVVSTAVAPTNVELAEAVRLGIPVAGRSEIMESLGRLRNVVAISGTHGKTTTSAMAARAAMKLGWNPSFIVGGVVNGLDTGVNWTDSDLLVVEADESDNSFLRFNAANTLITNIEPDHLDFHGDMAHLQAAFDRFVTQRDGPSVVCNDDAGCRELLQRVGTSTTGNKDSGRIHTYGFSEGSDYRISDARSEGLRTWCTIHHRGSNLATLELNVLGMHNARNATGIFSLFHQMGGDPHAIADGLTAFSGVGRRFEFRGRTNDITFIDDYAHLPTEVSTVLSAAKNAKSKDGWSRVVAVFQPHRFTRIRDVGADFASSFADADLTIIAGLYSAGQEPIANVSAHTVADAVLAYDPTSNVRVIENRSELVSFLQAELQAGDLCLTMNAGDLTTLPDELQMLLGRGR
jgi:UDP-N-acetylmuramate--alanine ligase